MNEAIGKLRLLELEPLKLAIMDALQRAWSFMPPLHVQSKEGPSSPPLEHGFERKVELQRAIDCLENAVKYGFGDPHIIRNDPYLKSLHAEPRYQELLVRTTKVEEARTGGR